MFRVGNSCERIFIRDRMLALIQVSSLVFSNKDGITCNADRHSLLDSKSSLFHNITSNTNILLFPEDWNTWLPMFMKIMFVVDPEVKISLKECNFTTLGRYSCIQL